MKHQFKTINVDVPDHDCDIVLKFTSGRHVLIQCRPGNADVNYRGSLDIILPGDQNVTCWEGDDMQPSRAAGRPETRFAKQLVTELP